MQVTQLGGIICQYSCSATLNITIGIYTKILLKALFISRPYLHEDHVDVERCAHVDQLEYAKTVARRRGACRKTFSQW